MPRVMSGATRSWNSAVRPMLTLTTQGWPAALANSKNMVMASRMWVLNTL